MRNHETSAESKATFGSVHIDLQSLYNAIPVDLALAIIKQHKGLRDAYSFYHSIHPIDDKNQYSTVYVFRKAMESLKKYYNLMVVVRAALVRRPYLLFALVG